MARTVRFRGIQEDVGLFDIIYSGIYTCIGTAATEVINIRGVEKTDVCILTGHGVQAHALLTAACGKNQISAVFADVVGTGHSQKMNVLVIRARNKVGAARRKY